MRVFAWLFAVLLLAACTARPEPAEGTPTPTPAARTIPQPRIYFPSVYGSGAMTPTPRPLPVPTPLPTVLPTATLTPVQAELLAVINQARAEHDLPPLSPHAGLTTAAQGHAESMRDGDFYGHDSADGSPWWERVSPHYQPWSGLGEVIAAGYARPERALAGWLSSDGHRAILLEEGDMPEWEHVGLGYAEGGKWRHYWVVDVGRP